MFKGAITALITPFTTDGKVDEKAFQSLVQWQVEQGIHGLVPCGTTGESPTLDYDEHNRVIELCVEAAAGKVPVIAGAGSNATAESIYFAEHAKKVGADAILVATPYYNKPNQEGLYQHFKAIHDAVDIPLVLYNIPGRSVIDLNDSTTARLAELPNIVGIKDATGDLSRTSSLRAALGSKKDDFCQLSGEDGTALAFNAQGGVGCISVTSNIAPKLVAKVQELSLEGKHEEALSLHDRLTPVHKAMFCDTSPGPAKYIANLLGLCQPGVRLPLVEPADDKKEAIRQAVLAAGVLE
jgi:4-hydroxy-tetrahydrodipicolinate synthase